MKDKGTDGVDATEAAEPGRLQAVDRVVGLLRVVSSSGGTLAAVSRAAGMSEATALRYLSSLAHHQLVERDTATRTYRIGPALLQLAYGTAGGGGDLLTVAPPAMRRLLEEFGETVNLGVRSGDALVVVHALESPRPIRKGAAVGDSDHWNCTALGKALLAAMPEEEARGLVHRAPSPRLTERTRLRWQDLADDLADTRRRGYALDDEESAEGLRCVGAAIVDREGVARYAISVSGPADRMSPDTDDAVGERVAAEATAIAHRLGGSSHLAASRYQGEEQAR